MYDETDMYARMDEGLPFFACKCWSPSRAADEEEALSHDEVSSLREMLGQAPGSNPYDNYAEIGEIDEDDENALIGPDYRIEVTVTVENGYGELILCDAERGGNTFTIYLRDANGHVGFSREGRMYSFDYTLPAGESVTIAFAATTDSVRLYEDGKVMATVGVSDPMAEHATLLFPVGDLLDAQDVIDDEGAYVITSPSGNRATVTDIGIGLQ